MMRFLFVLLIVCSLSACQTVTPREDTSDQAARISGEEALISIAGALAERPLTKEDLENLKKQLKTDSEARSAVEVITNSVRGKEPLRAKYCPVGGEHYAPNLKVCPIHKIELKTAEE